MNRVIAVASIVVTVAYALRPEARGVLVSIAERRVTFDSATQQATIHARLRNNTRDTTMVLGCLGVPAIDIERHVGERWVRVGNFPCPIGKAYPTATLAKSATVTVPLRVSGPGEYRLRTVWIPRGYLPNQGRQATSLAFVVR